jgi:hypothetical protein
MGLDFIRRNAKTFTKAWNRNRVDLARPTLFMRYPECYSRSFIADLFPDAALSPGVNVVVCSRGPELILISGTTQIGMAPRPPADLLNAIHEDGGCVLGRISRINSISGTVDVEVE